MEERRTKPYLVICENSRDRNIEFFLKICRWSSKCRKGMHFHEWFWRIPYHWHSGLHIHLKRIKCSKRRRVIPLKHHFDGKNTYMIRLRMIVFAESFTSLSFLPISIRIRRKFKFFSNQDQFWNQTSLHED